MLDSSKLANVPRQSELYYWADFVELLCLTDDDREFSANRLGELLNLADDLATTSPDAQDADMSDVIDGLLDAATDDVVGVFAEEFGDQILDDDEDDTEEDGSHDGRAAEVADDRREWCANIFRLLADRQKTLGVNYPFVIDEPAMRIRTTKISPHLKRYIFYLLCSSLGAVDKTTMQALTACFEVVSADVLRALLPQSAEIDQYGTARSRQPSRFSGSTYERLKGLAAELRGKVLASPGDFHPRDRGDNGLDLVAWIPMKDRAHGVPCFFVQCACGAKWDGKQYEASPERWGQFIHLSSPPTKMTFIPHYFRGLGGDWYSSADVSGILVDRRRSLQLVSGELTQTEAVNLVDEALSFSRPVAE